MCDQLSYDELYNIKLQHLRKIDDLKTEWETYTKYLQKKYPTDGKWKFTCEHHKKIDEILKRD